MLRQIEIRLSTEHDPGGTPVEGITTGTTDQTYTYFVKNSAGSGSTLTFPITDQAGNYGQPNLTVDSLSFIKRDQTESRTFTNMTDNQNYFSILSKDGDLRNVALNINGETVPAGEVKAVDLKPRLRSGFGNTVQLSAEGTESATALALVSSAILVNIDDASIRRGYRRGDMNEDGRWSIGDATRHMKAIVGLDALSPPFRTLADVNRDGKLNLADASLFIKEMVYQ
jgi:hypothetical protein